VASTSPITIDDFLGTNTLASAIGLAYDRWDDQREQWKQQVSELRDYIFATDTRSTSNSTNGWQNSTTLPKLTQLRDVLHAQYMAALFPSEDWLAWVADDPASDTAEKRQAITQYMRHKIRTSGFMTTFSQLLYDLIDTGNMIGRVDFLDDKVAADSGAIRKYRGPVLNRLSTHDVVFNPTVSKFDKSPTITRTVSTFAELLAQAEDDPTSGYDEEQLKNWLEGRRNLSEVSPADVKKWRGYRVDGFGDMTEYFRSQYVEVLELEGDWYDPDAMVLHRNKVITVLDRTWVVRNQYREEWVKKSVFHNGWRLRPDNLWAMGPLDNLVGMQYRVDHIENAKADAIDQFIIPKVKIRGVVEDFDDKPGEGSGRHSHPGEQDEVRGIAARQQQPAPVPAEGCISRGKLPRAYAQRLLFPRSPEVRLCGDPPDRR